MTISEATPFVLCTIISTFFVCSVNKTRNLTRAAVAVSITVASCSVRGLCTADTVCSRVARLLVRLRLMVTGLVIFIEGPGASACGAGLNDNILAGVASERGLVLPRAVLFLGIVALAISIAPCRRASAMVGVLDVHFHTAANQGTERSVLGTDAVIAVDSAEIVPKVVLTGNEIVLHLNDAGRCDLVVWQIAKLDRDTAVCRLAIDHTLISDRIGRDSDGLVVFNLPSRAGWADRPRVNVVGAVVNELDVFLCRDDSREDGSHKACYPKGNNHHK